MQAELSPEPLERMSEPITEVLTLDRLAKDCA